jgi:hypothetical protein
MKSPAPGYQAGTYHFLKLRAAALDGLRTLAPESKSHVESRVASPPCFQFAAIAFIGS